MHELMLFSLIGNDSCKVHTYRLDTQWTFFLFLVCLFSKLSLKNVNVKSEIRIYMSFTLTVRSFWWKMTERKIGLSICALDKCSTLQANKGVLAIADVCEVLTVQLSSCKGTDGLLKYTAERHLCSKPASQSTQSTSYQQISSFSVSILVSLWKSSTTGCQPACQTSLQTCMQSISLLSGQPPQTQSPHEPAGQNLIITLALITDCGELSLE